MTTANPPESGHEPSDLSELAATDALLDRLGGREPSDDDLNDATAAALAQLTAFVDESREVDQSMARLVEVLAGRPLYVAEPEEPTELAALDRTALDRAALDRPALDRAAKAGASAADPERDPRVIDLTERSPIAAPAGDSAEGLDELDGQAEPALTPAASVATLPRQAGASRWERALAQVSLPAAALVLLLALGGGLSAVVTGNPMTAVNGVSRAMNQLPGVDTSKSSIEQVNDEILAARIAMRKHDKSAAQRHLYLARRALSNVPEDQQSGLIQVIAGVESEVSGDVPVPVVTDPGIGVDPTSVPDPVLTTAAPVPSETPTPTPTTTSSDGSSPDPTTPATTDPAPSTGSSTPDTPATTAASAAPTAAATQSASGTQS
jgi:hypothetical protein